MEVDDDGKHIPTSGGVAPLYTPRAPSCRTVFSRQSNGPANCDAGAVCMRTLMVSNLHVPSACLVSRSHPCMCSREGTGEWENERKRDPRVSDYRAEIAPSATNTQVQCLLRNVAGWVVPVSLAMPEKTPAAVS